MFNDKLGLTHAVLNGTKTVTRRIITPQPTYSDRVGIEWKGYAYGIGFHNPTSAYKNFITGTEYSKKCNRYRVGEIVAIAQCYGDIICGAMFDKWEIDKMEESAGYRNKMFVKAELMPNRIQIIDVRIERLQDKSCFYYIYIKHHLEKNHKGCLYTKIFYYFKDFYDYHLFQKFLFSH